MSKTSLAAPQPKKMSSEREKDHRNQQGNIMQVTLNLEQPQNREINPVNPKRGSRQFIQVM